MTSNLFNYTLYNNKETTFFDNLQNDYMNAIKNVENLLTDNTNINIREKLNELLDKINLKEGMINKEGFDDRGFQTPYYNEPSYDTVVSQQIIPMQSIANDYSNLLVNIDSQYRDLSGNVVSLDKNIQTLSGEIYKKYGNINNDLRTASSNIRNINGLRDTLNSNSVYDFNANLQNWNNKDMTIQKAHIDDINALLYSQNSIFIMGTMTTTVLLIFMIYALKE